MSLNLTNALLDPPPSTRLPLLVAVTWMIMASLWGPAWRVVTWCYNLSWALQRIKLLLLLYIIKYQVIRWSKWMCYSLNGLTVSPGNIACKGPFIAPPSWYLCRAVQRYFHASKARLHSRYVALEQDWSCCSSLSMYLFRSPVRRQVRCGWDQPSKVF